MSKTVQNIIDFIYEWQEKKNISDDVSLNDNQIKTFVTELHAQITQMEFSVPEGSTIIAYSGKVNGTPAHEVAEKISKLYCWFWSVFWTGGCCNRRSSVRSAGLWLGSIRRNGLE